MNAQAFWLGFEFTLGALLAVGCFLLVALGGYCLYVLNSRRFLKKFK